MFECSFDWSKGVSWILFPSDSLSNSLYSSTNQYSICHYSSKSKFPSAEVQS